MTRAGVMLELDDIQHFLLTRPPAPAARYEFLSFRDGAEARRGLPAWSTSVGTRRDRSRPERTR